MAMANLQEVHPSGTSLVSQGHVIELSKNKEKQKKGTTLINGSYGKLLLAESLILHIS